LKKGLLIKNLNFLKDKAPGLVRYLASNLEAITANVRVVEKSNGDFDLIVGGQVLQNIKKEAEKKASFNDFALINPPWGMETEDFRQYYETLKKKFLEIAKGLNREDFFEKTDFLVVFGTLPFFHIPKLVEELKSLRKVFIVEPRPEFLFLFLSLVDLQKILKPGLTISFISNEEEFEAKFGANFLTSVFASYFMSYSDVKIEKFKEIMKDCFNERLTVRPFENISSSFRHTARNLSLNPLVLNKKGKGREEVVCIVGTGPSLNKSYGFLKRFQDKMVIVCLGSALRPLVFNQIFPDFVTVLDPMPNIGKRIFKDIKKEDASKSCLISAFVVDNEFVKMFKPNDRLFFGFESPLGMFEGKFLPNEFNFPTVLNYTLEVLYHLGFRKFLLVGVDLGTKDPEVLHARGYAYGEGMLGRRNLIVQEGNFGGRVFSPVDFWISKKVFEKQLAKFKDAVVYNLSDGVKIQRTTPFHMEDGFPFEEKEINKEFLKKEIKSLFKRSSELGIKPSKLAKKQFKSFATEFPKALAKFNEYLRTKSFKELESGIKESLDSMEKNIAIGLILGDSPFEHFIRTVGRYLGLIDDEEKKKEFVKQESLEKIVRQCVDGVVKIQHAMKQLLG
jgi:hypothetical protein